MEKRESDRANAGKPPNRFSPSDYDSRRGQAPPPVPPRTPRAPPSVRSEISNITAVSLSRRRLEIEVQAEEERMESERRLAEQRAEHERQRSELKRKINLAKLAEEEAQANGGNGSQDGESENPKSIEDWMRGGSPYPYDLALANFRPRGRPEHPGGLTSGSRPPLDFQPQSDPQIPDVQLLSLNRIGTRPNPPGGFHHPTFSPNSPTAQGQFDFSTPFPIYNSTKNTHPLNVAWSGEPPQTRNFTPTTQAAQASNPFAQNHQNQSSGLNMGQTNPFLNSSEQFMTSMVDAIRHIRPPRDLPSFGGELEDWPRFIADFHQSTLQRRLSNVDNVHRLQKALKGKALEAVRSLLVSPDNLPRILATLELRFGRPELIIEQLSEKAKKINAIKEGQFDLIVDFGCQVDNLVTTIETLRKPEYLRNPMLIREFEEKLPPSLKVQWAIFNRGWRQEITLRHFADWLQQASEDLIRFVKVVPTSATTKEEKKSKTQEKKSQATKSVLVGAVEEEKKFTAASSSDSSKEKPGGTSSSQSKPKKCSVCSKEGHTAASCPQFKDLSIEEKRKFANENRLCFNCLNKHFRKECKSTNTCRKCGETHHTSLHVDKTGAPKPTQSDEEQKKASEVIGNIGIQEEYKILSQIAPITIFGPDKSIKSFVFFDIGAKVSLIDEETAKQLGFVLNKRKSNLSWVDGSPKEIYIAPLKLKIQGQGEKEVHEVDVLTFPNLKLPSQSVTKIDLQKWGVNFQDIHIPTYTNAKPCIVLGLDHLHLFHPSTYRKDRPIVIQTKLGWTVYGPTASKPNQDSEVHFVGCIDQPEPDLHSQVIKYFTTEEFGVRPSQPLESAEDIRAKWILQQTTKRIGNKWETGLLWKEDFPRLPESKEMALRRLKSIEKKMDSDPEFGKKYDAKMQEYFSKGYARAVTPEEMKMTEKVWYLPHFYVSSPKKPDKFRIVWDAKAKSHGKSLNDFLMAGPDLSRPLPEIIVKFRQYKIAFSGDIQDFFHRILLILEDIHAQRFFYRGFDRESPPLEYVLLVLSFGATSSPCSAQYVRNENAEEFKKKLLESCLAIIEKHFMDDYMDSTPDLESARKRISEVQKIHGMGGFLIGKWISSDAEALSEVPKELCALEKSIGFSNSEKLERVLGLYWSPIKDLFSFKTSFVTLDEDLVNGTKHPTKREILKVLMSLFDPMGFIAPFLIKAKILLQNIWRTGIGWDDEIPILLLEKWKNWTRELKSLNQVSLPRCYEDEAHLASEIELHVFVDASEAAFAAAAYFRFKFQTRVSIAFVMGKSRVAPLRPMSIPRLELQAAVLGSRLAETIKQIHDYSITKTTFWSDSTTVIQWLTMDARRLNTFVANRIGEIQESTGGAEWRWIPTKENVADDATRDGADSDFSMNGRWLQGPSFLLLPPDQWPQPAHINVVQKLPIIEPIKINYKNFSNFDRLLRAMAWVKRSFKKNQDLKLSVDEIKSAEIALWKHVQSESFPKEVQKLKEGDKLPTKSRLIPFSAFMDSDGLIRMKGRAENSKDLSYDARYPILLDPSHPVTILLMHRYHRNAHHQGQETVLNELRQKYWILHGRSAIRKTFCDCQACKVMKPIPVLQEMAPLPSSRITTQRRAFVETGLDYFGPMEVTVGRHHEKRYGALFTCMSTRAVHIEIAHSLSTDSVIMAIRRFIARRGHPEKILSDNGSNFIGANRVLRESFAEVDLEKIGEKMTTLGIHWQFNPPYAPHMGGAWERLVRSVKTSLKAILHERFPKDEVLHTFILEAEAMVNSRPLTYVSSDPSDPEALTPNHFLIGSSSGTIVPGKFGKEDLMLRQQWRQAQALADLLWQRWLKEYLPGKNQRTKWRIPGYQAQVGDIVFIADNSLPRGQWVRGIIKAVYPGKDKQIRTVDVGTSSGLYRRPITSLLFPRRNEDRR